ncbi:MAG TPA: NAD(P)H-binding protein [Prolixibacteraceae bacterium]|nr:NAD(P)H-binding protein [Prolixibacteraceae bacterium]
MRTAIIAGASGLIGKDLVQKLINSDQYRLIYVLSRKKSDFVREKIRELVIDFEKIAQLKFDEPIDDVFCTLGTTMKQAGSRDNFKKVDYEYVVALANLGKQYGASKFIVVSAMGANSKSAVFYNKIKGMTEDALKNIGFNQLIILRPSLLLGVRVEKRFPERLSGIFMKFFNFLIPDNYKAIQAEKVAENMLKMALKSTEKVLIVKSGEML